MTPAIDRRVAGRTVKNVGHVTPQEHLAALTDLVKRLARRSPGRPLSVIEVGSWVGESAIALHAGLSAEAGGTVLCVDHFQGNRGDHLGGLADVVDVEKYFLENTQELPDIRLLKKTSLEAAVSLPLQFADMIFIDASHEYQDVKDDINAWLPHVVDTGILSGHDYCDAFPGVKQAVQELFVECGCNVYVYSGTSVWLVKKAEYLNALSKNIQ